MNNEIGMTAHLLTTRFAKYFKPAVEAYYSKKDFFAILLPMYNACGHSRDLMEKYNEIHIVFTLTQHPVAL